MEGIEKLSASLDDLVKMEQKNKKSGFNKQRKRSVGPQNSGAVRKGGQKSNSPNNRTRRPSTVGESGLDVSLDELVSRSRKASRASPQKQTSGRRVSSVLTSISSRQRVQRIRGGVQDFRSPPTFQSIKEAKSLRGERNRLAFSGGGMRSRRLGGTKIVYRSGQAPTLSQRNQRGVILLSNNGNKRMGGQMVVSNRRQNMASPRLNLSINNNRIRPRKYFLTRRDEGILYTTGRNPGASGQIDLRNQILLAPHEQARGVAAVRRKLLSLGNQITGQPSGNIVTRGGGAYHRQLAGGGGVPLTVVEDRDNHSFLYNVGTKHSQQRMHSTQGFYEDSVMDSGDIIDVSSGFDASALPITSPPVTFSLKERQLLPKIKVVAQLDRVPQPLPIQKQVAIPLPKDLDEALAGADIQMAGVQQPQVRGVSGNILPQMGSNKSSSQKLSDRFS